MKNKKIEFIAGIPDVEIAEKKFIPPIESIKKIPEWYKDLAPFGGSSHNIKDVAPLNDRGGDGTFVSTKLCLPFFDALSLGYMYCLEDDVTVSLDKKGIPSLSWSKELILLDKRPTVDQTIPKECHPIQFGVRTNWYYKTPPGYSVLFTNPMNRFDLPFYSASGVVDADIWGLPVFVPLFLKRNFMGTISAGTPLFQIIPFKRDNWEKQIIYDSEEHDKHNILEEKRRTNIFGYYKKYVWQKKTFL